MLVDRIRLQAEGTFYEKEDITSVAVYRDTDGNHTYSSKNKMVGQAKQFVDVDSLDFLYDSGGVISPGTPELWLIVNVLSDNAPNDGSVTMQIKDVDAIESRGIFPSTPIVESDEFPLLSDTLSLGEGTVGLGINDWLAEHFLPEERNNPEISGLNAYPDMDGLSNLLEYAYGLNSKFAHSMPFEASNREIDGTPYLHVYFAGNISAGDLEHVIESSINLTDWT